MRRCCILPVVSLSGTKPYWDRLLVIHFISVPLLRKNLILLIHAISWPKYLQGQPMFSYASIMLENHFLIFSIVCSFHLVNIYSFIKVNVYSIDITDGIRLRYYMNAEKGRVSIIIHGLCHLLSPCQAAGQQLELYRSTYVMLILLVIYFQCGNRKEFSRRESYPTMFHWDSPKFGFVGVREIHPGIDR